MPDDNPVVGSVGFWERVATLGVRGVLTIGLDASYVVMIFIGLVAPKEFIWLVFAMNGWLIGSEFVKAVQK